MNAKNSAPTSNGANAIDIWMLGCVIMVFAALCAYGMLLYMKRRPRISIPKISHTARQSKHLENPTNISSRKICNSGKVNEENVGNAQILDAWDTDYKGVDHASAVEMIVKDMDVKRIDYISFVLFPIVFLVFIIAYLVCFKRSTPQTIINIH